MNCLETLIILKDRLDQVLLQVNEYYSETVDLVAFGNARSQNDIRVCASPTACECRCSSLI